MLQSAVVENAVTEKFRIQKNSWCWWATVEFIISRQPKTPIIHVTHSIPLPLPLPLFPFLSFPTRF